MLSEDNRDSRKEQFKLENTGNYLAGKAWTETIAWGVNTKNMCRGYNYPKTLNNASPQIISATCLFQLEIIHNYINLLQLIILQLGAYFVII